MTTAAGADAALPPLTVTGADVLLGDALQVLPRLAAGVVDAIVTDPPYGISYQSAWRKKARFAVLENDDAPCVEWMPEAFRVLRDGGAVLCFCRWDVQEAFRAALEAAGFTIKSQVIWDRDNHGMGDLQGAFAPCHDVIWFAVKGRFKFPGARPRSVVRSGRLNGEAMTHPTEKPVDLMRRLVSYVAKEGDLVLDPFAGSGATGMAAVLHGCRFLGVEINEEYAAKARTRLLIAAGQRRLESFGGWPSFG